jgi:hypothetical protein
MTPQPRITLPEPDPRDWDDAGLFPALHQLVEVRAGGTIKIYRLARPCGVGGRDLRRNGQISSSPVSR